MQQINHCYLQQHKLSIWCVVEEANGRLNLGNRLKRHVILWNDIDIFRTRHHQLRREHQKVVFLRQKSTICTNYSQSKCIATTIALCPFRFVSTLTTCSGEVNWKFCRHESSCGLAVEKKEFGNIAHRLRHQFASVNSQLHLHCVQSARNYQNRREKGCVGRYISPWSKFGKIYKHILSLADILSIDTNSFYGT